MSLMEMTPAYREPTISDFEDAFDVLLTAYLDQKRKQVGTKRLYLKEVMVLSEIPGQWKAQLLEVLENPLASALREAMRDLAQRYHDFLKAELKVENPLREMEASLYNIAGRDIDQEGRRGSILDKVWDGVGDGKCSWMA